MENKLVYQSLENQIKSGSLTETWYQATSKKLNIDLPRFNLSDLP